MIKIVREVKKNMIDKKVVKSPRKPRSGFINFAGQILLCLETYQTLKRRLLDGSDFIEVTDGAGFKSMINKKSIQALQVALEKPEEEIKKEGKK